MSSNFLFSILAREIIISNTSANSSILSFPLVIITSLNSLNNFFSSSVLYSSLSSTLVIATSPFS